MAQYLDMDGVTVLANEIKEKADKTYVDEQIAAQAEKIYTPKGAVDTYNDLPVSPAVGDIYQVNGETILDAGTDDEMTYPPGTDFKYTAGGWVAMPSNGYDMSTFVTKEEVGDLTGVEAIPVASVRALFA